MSILKAFFEFGRCTYSGGKARANWMTINNLFGKAQTLKSWQKAPQSEVTLPVMLAHTLLIVYLLSLVPRLLPSFLYSMQQKAREQPGNEASTSSHREGLTSFDVCFNVTAFPFWQNSTSRCASLTFTFNLASGFEASFQRAVPSHASACETLWSECLYVSMYLYVLVVCVWIGNIGRPSALFPDLLKLILLGKSWALWGVRDQAACILDINLEVLHNLLALAWIHRLLSCEYNNVSFVALCLVSCTVGTFLASVCILHQVHTPHIIEWNILYIQCDRSYRDRLCREYSTLNALVAMGLAHTKSIATKAI